MFDDINNNKDKNKDDLDGPTPAAQSHEAGSGKSPTGLGPQDALELAKAGIKKMESVKKYKNTSGPGTVEDIFADTETSGAPAEPSGIPAADALPPHKYEGSIKSGNIAKKLSVLATIVVLVAGLGFGAFWLYNNFLSTGDTLPEMTEDPIPDVPAETPPADADAGITAPAMETPAPEPDSDQDGLTDAEEAQLGTNPATVDSDNDGLFDREEVKVYGTDPLNPDSDGDGFLDGAEVEGGYNPLGPGMLYDVSQPGGGAE